MDLWHGNCRDAFKVDNASEKSPEFELSAPLKIWRGVLEKKIDPIQGLVTRRLKLKGPWMRVMKAPKAAIELVEACSKLDTDWPEA
jgi:putative sterol carrier protein